MERIKGLDVESLSNADGHTALRWASVNMHFEFAKLLLSVADAQRFLDVVPQHGRSWEPIQYAAANGDENMIKLFGLSVDWKSPSTPSLPNHPIHLAAASPGNLEAIKELHKAGAPLIIKENHTGWTAMHWAAMRNKVPTLQYLDEHGLSAEENDLNGKKPIHIAAEWGHVEVVRWLKESGANVSSVFDREGNLPVHLAVVKGHLRVIQYLRNSANHLHDWCGRRMDGNFPLHVAAQCGNLNVIRYLLLVGCAVNDINNAYDTALHLAVGQGHIEVIRELASLGADISAKNRLGDTPLHLAVGQGNIEMTKDLIRLGADVSAKNGLDDTPLHLALAQRHIEMTRDLISLGADVSAQNRLGNTPLHSAAEQGSIEVIRDLTGHGADQSAQNTLGEMPLHVAARQGHLEAIRCLKDGVDLSARNKSGETSLHLAAEGGYINVVRYLASQESVDVNAISHCGWTPTHSAASKNQAGVIEVLRREFQASLNIGWGWGAARSTALHIAAENGHHEAARQLVNSGAEKSLKDCYGRRPWEMAGGHGHRDLANELKTNGCGIL
jgi:ankyrin repeat protein